MEHSTTSYAHSDVPKSKIKIGFKYNITFVTSPKFSFPFIFNISFQCFCHWFNLIRDDLKLCWDVDWNRTVLDALWDLWTAQCEHSQTLCLHLFVLRWSVWKKNKQIRKKKRLVKMFHFSQFCMWYFCFTKTQVGVCLCVRVGVHVCVYWPVTSSTLGLISRSGPTSKALWVRRWTSKTQREYNYLIYGYIDQSAITFLPLTGDIKITKQWVICTLKV